MATAFVEGQFSWPECSEFQAFEHYWPLYPPGDVHFDDSYSYVAPTPMPLPRREYRTDEMFAHVYHAEHFNARHSPENPFPHTFGTYPPPMHDPGMTSSFSFAPRQHSPTTAGSSPSSWSSEPAPRDALPVLLSQIRPELNTADGTSYSYVMDTSSHEYNASCGTGVALCDVHPPEHETLTSDMHRLETKLEDASFKREPYFDDIGQGPDLVSSYDRHEQEHDHDGVCSHHERQTSPTNDSGVSLTSSDSDSEYSPSNRRKKARNNSVDKLARGKIGKRPSPKLIRKQACQAASTAVEASTWPVNANRVDRPAPGVGNAAPATTAERNRVFSCPLSPYGCAQTFGNKNEWKRHIWSQHLNLAFWRCDLCPDADVSPNDFGRKDLFTQHIRRMHTSALEHDSPAKAPSPGQAKPSKSTKPSRRSVKPAAAPPSPSSASAADPSVEAKLSAIRARCHVKIRDPPSAAACAACGERFTSTGCAERWLEHTGRHLLDAARHGGAVPDAILWERDAVLREWLAREDLIERVNGAAAWTVVDAERLTEHRAEAIRRKEDGNIKREAA